MTPTADSSTSSGRHDRLLAKACDTAETTVRRRLADPRAVAALPSLVSVESAPVIRTLEQL